MTPRMKKPFRRTLKTERKKAKAKLERFRKNGHPHEEHKVKPDDDLILYYLSKLRKLFASPDYLTDGMRVNSGEKMRRQSTGVKMRRPFNYSMNNDIKEEACNVVNDAIEYGFKNNVIERRGNCFILKNRQNPKLANRQQTPGPTAFDDSLYTRCQCSQCKIVKAADTFTNSEMARTISKNNFNCLQSNNVEPLNTYPSHLRESRTIATLTTNSPNPNPLNKSPRSRSRTNIGPSPLEGQVKKKCNCKKCNALEQKRKPYVK
ncbi:hypothetical protein JTB14_000379 [Gonioctena quinquepunctata]|nr:hypothetical protein JTB14_000379 [Gonioctena quinquepunctata]